MPSETFYFKQFNNKIPCGGFYQMGGTIKNKYIEDERFRSMFAKTIGSGEYLRCIAMNLDDYFTIKADVDNGVYKKYYDVKFLPMDFLDKLQVDRAYKELNKWVEKYGEEGVDEYTLIKTFFSFMYNGKPMDMYDVIDLYVNNLGLKSVPSSDDEWITVDTNCILAYYGKLGIEFSNFIKNSTVVYSAVGGNLGNIASDFKIGNVTGTITFFKKENEEYGQHKNVVDFTQAAP